jgi:hypothetical protein
MKIVTIDDAENVILGPTIQPRSQPYRNQFGKWTNGNATLRRLCSL